LTLVCSRLISFSFLLDASSDSAKALEQLLSKEVADVSAQIPESVGEMMKVIEGKDKQLEEQGKQLAEQGKVIEDKDKQLEVKDKEIEQLRVKNQEKDDLLEEQARRIKELEEALLAGKK